MLQKLLSGPGRFITHLVTWLLVATVMFYLISTMRPVGEAAQRTLLNLLFPFVIFYVNGRVLINHFFEKKRWGWWALLSVLLCFGMAALRTRAELAIFGGTIFNQNIFPSDGGWKIFLVMSLIFFLLMVFSGLYQLLENRRELETLHAEAQLNYLKAQINPHFLFNTLNNIYSAATLQHPRTPDMVLRLSDLLRYVTYEAQATQVSVAQEINHIRAYIDLFQLKSATPLPIFLDVDSNLNTGNIEPLLLLPMVENALKHSDLDTNEKAFVKIILRQDSDKLVFRVENTFNALDQQKDDVGGVGLANITRRIALTYPDRHSFTTSAENGVFTAELMLKNGA